MSETLGALIGLSNVVTRALSRVPAAPDPDALAGERDRLHTLASRALEGHDSFIHDAVVLGRRVRLFTNSHHLADFWKDDFPSEGEWRALTGERVARDPALTVYAAIHVQDEGQSSCTSARRNEAYLFNTSYYADLRACALESLGRILAPEGIRILHGGAVEAEGRGLLMLYPKEILHPTPVWGLMEASSSRFIADGWVAVDSKGAMRAVEKSLYFRASVVAGYPEIAPRILAAKYENVPPARTDGVAAGQALYEQALRGDSQQALRSLPADLARGLLARLAASADARALADPVRLFGKSRVLRDPVPVASVFSLKAETGQPVAETHVDGFACPAYEVRAGGVGGHPRELARIIGSAR